MVGGLKGGRVCVETALIKKILNGNEHAFRVLVEKYRVHIFKNVFAVLRNQKDAEDAVQEVFVKIYTSLPHYENQGFKTWITRIAINHAIDMKRKKTRRPEEQLTDAQEESLIAASENTEQIVLQKELQLLIRERMNELPPNYRELIYQFYIKEKTYKELAEEQQVKVKTIETKLYRARIWMKNNWKEEDFR